MITPEQLANGTEHGSQAALFCWAALNKETYPELEYMFAIPNGGQRNAATGARLKAEGVKAGVLDIFLPVARSVWHGLWVEMKTAKGQLSQEQKDWIKYLRDAGYGVAVCKSWDEARDVIKGYLEFGK
jgi:hypothetical protein